MSAEDTVVFHALLSNACLFIFTCITKQFSKDMGSILILFAAGMLIYN